MSTTENEEVASSEAPVDASAEPKTGEENVESGDPTGTVDAEGTGAVEAAPDEDESLDIEVEASEPAPEVELNPMAILMAQLEESEKAKQENYDRFVRTTADLENLRKRSRREVKDGRLDERGKILRDMLPVVDNLERAMEHALQNENEATKSIVEGVQMVLRQFHQALVRNNVTALEAVGKPFDPAVHEAVSQAPSEDHPPGTVISALQTGYMMEERLLRPALVVVSIAMPEPVEETAEAEASTDEVADEASADEAPASDAESEEQE